MSPGLKFNRHQRLAYDNPTIEGQYATHLPDGWFIHNETVDDQAVTVGVTVDVSVDNYESHGTDAVWMTSVSVWPTSAAEMLSNPEGLPIEVAKWTEHHKEIAAKAHGGNVEGIGVRGEPDAPQPQGLVWPGTYSLHLRVPLSEEEREGLAVEPR